MAGPISGKPGTTFVNRTNAVLYQWHALNDTATCGKCLARDGKVGDWSPPAHNACRCWVDPVYPGREAPRPFVSLRARLRSMTAAVRAKVLGASLARLFRRGLVTIDDLIDEATQDIKSLAQVIAAKHLTNRQLLAAGIAAWIILAARRKKRKAEPPPEKRKKAEPPHEPDEPDDELEQLERELEEAHEPKPPAVTPVHVAAGAPVLAGLGLIPPDAGRRQAAELLAALR